MSKKIKSSAQQPIAVVGVSALYPGSSAVDGFWKNIINAEDQIREVPPTHWLIEDYYDPDPTAPDKTYCKTGAFLDPVPFNPMEFGMPPNAMPSTDTAQLLALIVAKKVLDDASNGQFKDLNKDNISVILGVASGTELLSNLVSRLQRPVWVKALRETGLPESQVQEACNRISDSYVPWQESSFPGLLGNVVAGRIANRFDLGGTNCVTDAACASSLSAMSMGISELYLGQSDMVITGGADALNEILMYMCFSKTPAFSPTGDCRPFSDKGDGTIIGEGIGMMALRRLEDAERDGNKIYAVISGYGTSSDGSGTSVYAPKPEGQAKALRRAYNEAGYSPSTVELLEAHGTGTKAGDKAEFNGVNSVFSESSPDTKQWCAIGSVKSQIGHTKASAGIAGMIKAVLSLNNKILPPTLKVDKPNPALNIEESAFYINTKTRPWIRASDHPRRASVSSFGFGGSNFHMALEEYKGDSKLATRFRALSSEMLLMSADNSGHLLSDIKKLQEELKTESNLITLAHQSQQDFNEKQAVRLAIIATNDADLADKLGKASDKITKDGKASFSVPSKMHYSVDKATDGKVAFIFPGQGSQYVDMGAELAMAFGSARSVWDDQASNTDETPLHQIVFPQPVFSKEDEAAQTATLTEMAWAQPSIAAVSLSQMAVLNQLGLKPDCVCGHSFGEVTALHSAGVFTEKDTIEVARKRGQLMTQAAADTSGAMSAVSTDRDTLEKLLTEWNVGVVIANHNSPSQIVISGETSAIEEAEKRLKEQKIRAKRLPVASAFHSHIVSSSSKPFHEFLNGLKTKLPTIPVYANTTAKPYAKKTATIKEQLANQLANQVRFVEQIDAMYAEGVRYFVEVGPGNVLTGLVKKCLEGRDHTAINLDRKGQSDVTMLWNGLAQLAVNGFEMNYASLWQDYQLEATAREKVSPHAMYIQGSNYKKPYPPIEGSAAIPKPNPEKPKEIPVVAKPAVAVSTATPVKKQSVQQPVVSTPPMNQTTSQPVQVAKPVVNKPVMQPVQQVSSTQNTNVDGMSSFMAFQKHTADAHNVFQTTMAESHQAFLNMAESALAGLSGGVQPTMPVHQPMAATQVTQSQPVVSTPAVAQPPVVTETPAPTVKVEATPVVAKVTPAPVVEKPVVAPVVATPAIDMRAILLEVVSEKTGYPEEMLDLEMELESGLGIDSIKRVEILSAFQEKAPGLPEVEPTDLANLNTLGEIVDFMQSKMPAGSASATVSIAPVATAPAIDFNKLLLEVVSEKTGYPEEMLDLDMELESGLGIDSIKRVEILSAFQERAPGMPDIEPTDLATLNTLGEIVSFMESKAPATSQAPVVTANVAPSVDLQKILLDVVAEKTGYPTEMLDLEMELESGLGIDSIKRVEILSAFQEQAPGIPEIEPNDLAVLNTLGEIVNFMQAKMPAGSAPVSTVTTTSSATPSVDLNGILLKVVAEKTGYPEDMIEMDMELEAGLGIDSIKRVEILSAFQEQAPGLPEIEPNDLAVLNTLGEIVSFMQAKMPASSAPVTSTATPSIDLNGLLLEVVAEKTGYPVDMIEMDMELEAGLGIDSIKRVEILSAFQEKAPGLPEIEPTDLATLNTLGEIVGYMQSKMPSASATTAPVAQNSAPSVNLEAILFEVVADKTGYPTEMLEMDMELEGGLGIDSIKRVEILSAFQEQAPGLPEIDPSDLAKLNTLGEIVDYMGQKSGSEVTTQTAQTVSSEPATQGVGRYILNVVDSPATGLRMAGLTNASNIAVTNDGQGIAQQLVDKLQTQGLKASLVDSLSADADVVIYMGGLISDVNAESALSINQGAFEAAKTVAAKFTESGGTFITVQDSGGRFSVNNVSVDRAWAAGLTGLVKTAALEWPKATLKAIDIESAGRNSDVIAQALMNELMEGGPEIEVGLSASGNRITLVSEQALLDGAGEAILNADSVLVVSGGARGVTAATLKGLAKAYQPKMVLLGRTPLEDEPDYCVNQLDEASLKRALLTAAKDQGRKITPIELGQEASKIIAMREVKGTLADIEKAGSKVKYIATDVRNSEALKTSLDPIRAEWGAITGLIHAAGTLADKNIKDKTVEQFERVFQTKVAGLAGLLDATKNDPLNVICLFSSVAGRGGNVGQCDYSMANEVLNKVAQAEVVRRDGKCLVKSVNWGPWDGGMVTPALKKHFQSMGIDLISLQDGTDYLVQELTNIDRGQIEIVVGGAAREMPQFLAANSQEKKMELWVNKEKYPYLLSHQIKGKPVIPMMQVVEWFMRMAQANRPDLLPVSLMNIKVLKGAMLENYEGVGDQLWVSCQENADDPLSYELSLLSANGIKHYSAMMKMDLRSRKTNASSDALKISNDNFKSWPWQSNEIYGDKLFHGDDFHVISELEGVSADGGEAVLEGTIDKQWPNGPWLTDTAALDGGLQLAILWGIQQSGKTSLPTGFEAFIPHSTKAIEGPVHCRFKSRMVGGLRSENDLLFTSKDGEVIAELKGLQMHMLEK